MVSVARFISKIRWNPDYEKQVGHLMMHCMKQCEGDGDGAQWTAGGI